MVLKVSLTNKEISIWNLIKMFAFNFKIGFWFIKQIKKLERKKEKQPKQNRKTHTHKI